MNKKQNSGKKSSDSKWTTSTSKGDRTRGRRKDESSRTKKSDMELDMPTIRP